MNFTIHMFRDPDCGDCKGGDHCPKCLLLDPKAYGVSVPRYQVGKFSCDFRPSGAGADDLLYAIQRRISDAGIDPIGKGLQHVVANLCKNRATRHNKRDTYVDLNGQKIGWKAINKAVEGLCKVYLLVREKGVKGRSAGIIKPTWAFQFLASRYMPLFVNSPRAVILKTRPTREEKKEGKRAQRLPISNVGSSIGKLESRLNEIREFLDKHPLLLMRHPNEVRVMKPILSMQFSGSFRLNGRVYPVGDNGYNLLSMGNDSYQNIVREERRILWLDGELVAEPDFSAHHIRLLYALENTCYDDCYSDRDPYHLILNGGTVDRGICKKIVMIAVNSTSRNEAIASYRKQMETFVDSRERRGEKVREAPYCSNISDVFDAFVEKHDVIAKHFRNGGNTGLKLGKIEGAIMVNAMYDLMKQGIPAYPVHDSLLVPQSKENKAIKALEKAYHQAMRALKRKNYGEPVIAPNDKPRVRFRPLEQSMFNERLIVRACNRA